MRVEVTRRGTAMLLAVMCIAAGAGCENGNTRNTQGESRAKELLRRSDRKGGEGRKPDELEEGILQELTRGDNAFCSGDFKVAIQKYEHAILMMQYAPPRPYRFEELIQVTKSKLIGSKEAENSRLSNSDSPQ